MSKDIISKLLNGFIGAAMAETPAVMTASGWKQNKSGAWEQKSDKESKQLADNLSTISSFSPTHPATAVGDALINKVAIPVYQLAKNKQLLPYIKSYLQHPTWTTYYHGSPTPFNIKEAHMGTANDTGLHATKNKAVAKNFKENNPSGIVYKFRAPKHKATTSDFGSNDVPSHLSINYILDERPIESMNYHYFNIKDKQLLKEISKSKVPFKLEPKPESAAIGA